jgi:excisionase family DNA binding protein
MLDYDYHEKLFSIKEAAKILNISPKTLNNLKRNGLISHIHYDRRIYFRYEDLSAFIEENLIKPFVKVGVVSI